MLGVSLGSVGSTAGVSHRRFLCCTMSVWLCRMKEQGPVGCHGRVFIMGVREVQSDAYPRGHCVVLQRCRLELLLQALSWLLY